MFFDLCIIYTEREHILDVHGFPFQFLSLKRNVLYVAFVSLVAYRYQEIWLLATNISVTTLNSLLISQYQRQQLIVIANFPKQTNTNDDFGVVADKSSLI